MVHIQTTFGIVMNTVKIPTKELTRTALNWAVAKCMEIEQHNLIENSRALLMLSAINGDFCPSTNDEQGGKLLDKEDICTITKKYLNETERKWMAYKEEASLGSSAFGPSRLIAGMRCIVAFRMGDKIEVPIDILNADYRASLLEITPAQIDEMEFDAIYALRVQQLEDEGMTTSDAQGCADYEDTCGMIISNTKLNLGKSPVQVEG